MKRALAKKNAKKPADAAQENPLFRLEAWEAALEHPQDFTASTFIDAAVSNQRTKEVLYELFSSLGDLPVMPDDNRPEWARQAWREFWRSLALLPDAKDTSESEQLGNMIGLLSEIPPDAIKGPLDVAGLHALIVQKVPKLRSDAAQLPPKEAADFFNAQKAGQERAAQFSQVSQRTKIFLVLAVAWQIVATFKSTSELFQWLRAIGKDNRFLIAPSTDSREIRKVCKVIGLCYPNRAKLRPSSRPGPDPKGSGPALRSLA